MAVALLTMKKDANSDLAPVRGGGAMTLATVGESVVQRKERFERDAFQFTNQLYACLLYTSPSPRD